MRDRMTALALGLLIGAAGVVGRATAIEPGTTVDQSNVDQVKDLLPPEVYAHFKKGDWKGVPWAPAAAGLAKRKFWVLEGVPKDRYYLYGKLELWGSTTRRGRGRGTGSSPGGASCWTCTR